MIYGSAIGFALAIFPVHFLNYVFINTENKQASLNVTLYRFIPVYYISTLKEENDKKKKSFDFKVFKVRLYDIFNQLCIYKVIQLADFGIKDDKNAYIALGQNALTTLSYKFLQINGNYAKLRNYTIFNEEHSEVRYLAKMVTIMNLIVVGKIFLIYVLEKINEYKNKKIKQS